MMPYKTREARNANNLRRYAAQLSANPALSRQQHQGTLSRRREKLGLQQPTRPMPAACELCGYSNEKRALCYDHNHETNLFRGWICAGCNTAVGRFGDNVAGALRVLAYLRAGEPDGYVQ